MNYLFLVLLLVQLIFSFVLLPINAFHSRFGMVSAEIKGLKTFSLKSTLTPDISEASTSEERVIVITEKAMSHLSFMKSKQPDAVTLRMGVRAGGCNGMSYVMDFIKEEDVLPDDHVEVYDGIKCVVDQKSLLFLFGLQLDYSDELIGGGFKFTNPNAGTSCGCGKSFGI